MQPPPATEVTIRQILKEVGPILERMDSGVRDDALILSLGDCDAIVICDDAGGWPQPREASTLSLKNIAHRASNM